MNAARTWAGQLASLLIALGCTHARPDLPPPTQPLTPSPNARFRQAAPPSLDGLPRWTPPQAQTRELANGMHVIVVERHERPIVSIRYANRAATLHPEEYPTALSVVTGDALLEGTIVSDDEVLKGHRVAGVRPRVYTSPDGTTVELDVLSFAFAPAVQVIADLVRKPELSPEGIRSAGRSQHDALFEQSKRVGGIVGSIEMGVLLGPKHPWATDTRTMQEHLETLTTADVSRFHERMYVPEVSALIVVGDASAEQVFALAEQHFGDWPRSKAAGVPPPRQFAPKEQKREVHAVHAGGEQSRLSMVQPAVGIEHPQYHAFQLMSLIVAGSFDSRSNAALRHELGATYGVRADLRAHRGGGYLRLSMSVENSQLYEAVSTFRRELTRLQDQLVSEAELDSAKSAYLSSFELSSTAGVASLLAMLDMQGLSPEWLVDVEAQLATTTGDQIRQLARAYFDPGRASIIAVGDLHRTLGDLKQLGKVTAYEVTNTNQRVSKRDGH